MKYYILALKKYATIEGRTTRKEYWMFVLFNILFIIAVRVLDNLLFGTPLTGGYGIQTIYDLFILVPGYTAVVRRLHDVGKSGWWFLRWLLITGIVTLMFIVYFFVIIGLSTLIDPSLAKIGELGIAVIPFVLFIIAACIWLFVLLVTRGTPGSNKYGPNPNEIPQENMEGTAEIM